MTRVVSARVADQRPAEGKDEIGRLRQRIDWEALQRWGWDPEREVFAPDAKDPVFGFVECQTAACEQIGQGRLSLCRRCAQLWSASPAGTSFEHFCQTVPASTRRVGRLCLLCRTSGHERPARVNGLCRACYSVMTYRGQRLDAYLQGDDEFGPASPRPSFGLCEVIACDRFADRGAPALCDSHEGIWRDDGVPRGAAFVRWCRRIRTLDAGSRVAVLRGLTDRAQMELLFGLWCAGQVERRVRLEAIQGAANLLRAREAITTIGLDVAHLRNEARALLAYVADKVRVALASRDSEAIKDDWDLRVFGRSGRALHFGPITQPWLKGAAKQWALDRLDTVESLQTVDRVIRTLILLSESLRRHREDRGVDPVALARSDMSAFASDLSHLEASAQLSRSMRSTTLYNIGQFLREARGMGLTRPGGPMAGLSEEVALQRADRIRDVAAADSGRALPQVVVDQLLDEAALQLLEDTADPDTRAMVELQAEVGRRTGELCGLRWGCLSYEEELDETGRMRPAPVLIHDMPKVAIRGCHLPISRHAEQVIKAQRARVQARFPDTPAAELALFPGLQHNPRGTKARSLWTFCLQFRTWLAALPRLTGPSGEAYDRSDITPYSLRHCYAQRHADQGVPIEVLAALMGHKKLTTTQGYYRVTQRRKRKAVDQLAKLQVDRSGDRSRLTVERLLDSEALRDTVGQVAVPFGVCREPTNVKAHGQACPFRHQCFGCTHFHTDPSYLPELRAHLTRMLGDRERLRAALPELEEWARQGAIPSAKEVAAIRRVIDRCQDLVADLADDEREEIDEAITVVRRTRAQLDTSVPVRFLGSVRQPTPTLFPNVEHQPEADDGG